MALEVVSWVAPDGVETVLSGQPQFELLWGRQGAFMPPIAFAEEPVPLQPGARLRQVQVGVREVDLPLLLRGADATALRALYRTLLHTFDPQRGDGKLRVQGPDGGVRELTCRYHSGLEGAEVLDKDAGGTSWRKVVLVLRAWDPYWYATAPTRVDFAVGSAATPFFPFFPLRLSASTVLGDAAVSNPGDVEAWPIWTITGPGSNLVLTNVTTGAALTLVTTLGASDVVTIDTRPGQKTVSGADGSNLFGTLNAASHFWALPRGSSSVRVELSGATGGSLVTLVYYPRYLGA
ncbi:MAG TPA: hypothetical protein VK066_07935 [Chloroflexota bacterium]|nr:hypothetical protein [Chloroflexota bacterium]